MASSLLLATLLLLPCLSSCAFPWPDNVTQHKGYIEVNKTHGANLFYWFFESRQTPEKDPLVVWLTGGPGCSSMLALLVENGPFLIPEGKTEPEINKYGWNSFTNVMFIDQPVGTGFSYVTSPLGYVTNEKTIGKELWTMIQEFYTLYPKYANLDLYIVGESYAGHYVPATAQVILESNSVYVKNLKGIGIGNGWVDPYIQYQAYAQFALQNKLINESTVKIAGVMYDACKLLIDTGVWLAAFPECQIIETFVLEAAKLHLGRSINVYDIRKKCEDPPLCYDFSRVDTFLNRKDVQADLGVNRKWESCTTGVHFLLLGDWIKDFKSATGKVLDQGRRVVVYSGKEDYICNYLGGSEWTNVTQWKNQDEFEKASLVPWQDGEGEVFGQVKSGGGLSFVQVERAGHMVPMDQPIAALDILDHLVNSPFP
ncbi:serine carboxypeptidase S10 family member 1-like [Halichondria panicea]|uniref:serine carboxypeptidase S10 family member 1-like n=1 Tax=Halichondria panicea TaxID=6063 RepID=UPI00312B6297